MLSTEAARPVPVAPEAPAFTTPAPDASSASKASAPDPAAKLAVTGAARVLLGASLILIAFNLRPLFPSLSVLLPDVMASTGVTPFWAGVMTTLPVVCLGLFAPLAARLALRWGMERVLLGVLIALALGTALRGLATVPALLWGSVLAGAAIALANVLLPALVKRDFSDRYALMTALYTTAICGGAALGAAATAPLKQVLNGAWAPALAAWALPVVLVAALWAPQAWRAGGGMRGTGRRTGGLYRDRLAWQVTLFMGMQSALAFCVLGWLAPILRERGVDELTAGLMVSVSILVQMASCLLTPALAARSRDQRAVCVGLLAIATIGLVGCVLAPVGGLWFWVLFQGAGQGGLLSAAMLVIILRAPDAQVAAQLSGMAQGVGYLLAAIGPLLVGLLRSGSDSFASSVGLFVVLGGVGMVAALRAGRTGHVAVRAAR